MAEYDNLLARMDDYLVTLKKFGTYDSTTQELVDALRALQTENTELREQVKALRLVGATREDDLNTRLRNAERVITEALEVLSDGLPHHRKLTAILSSYPLGEGQTLKLDPTPIFCFRDDSKWAWGHVHEGDTFHPASEFSQRIEDYRDVRAGSIAHPRKVDPSAYVNRADHEGQTQQGDER